MSFRSLFNKKPINSSNSARNDGAKPESREDKMDPLFISINKQVIANTYEYCQIYYAAIQQELNRCEAEASPSDKALARQRHADTIMKELQGLIQHTKLYPSHKCGLIYALQDKLRGEISLKVTIAIEAGFPLTVLPEKAVVLPELFENFKTAFIINDNLNLELDTSTEAGESEEMPPTYDNEIFTSEDEISVSQISNHSNHMLNLNFDSNELELTKKDDSNDLDLTSDNADTSTKRPRQ